MVRFLCFYLGYYSLLRFGVGLLFPVDEVDFCPYAWQCVESVFDLLIGELSWCFNQRFGWHPHMLLWRGCCIESDKNCEERGRDNLGVP